MSRTPSLPLAVVGVTLLAAVGVVAIGAATAGRDPGRPGTQSPSGSAETSPPQATYRVAASPASSPTTTPPPGTTLEALPVEPDLPAAIATIGDSLSVAFDVEPGRFGPAREHSWVVGTDPDDGVRSHLERIRELGATGLAVIDAAREGARMDDAVGQATLVVQGAADLVPGAEVYVTFELGANDICRGGVAEMTSTSRFAAGLRAALAVLRDGTTVGGRTVPPLPPGSRLLVLSVPNVLGLREVFAGNARAQSIYAEFGVCRAALGADRTRDELAVVAARLRAYDRILAEACEAIASTREGGLDCRHDQAGLPSQSLSGATFQAEDVSTLDYFHPSLGGQARVADGAWLAGYWPEAEPTS